MSKATSKPRSSRAKTTRASVDNAVRGAAAAFRDIDDGRRYLAADVAMATLMGRREGFADACATSAIANMTTKVGEWPAPASDRAPVTVRDVFAAVALFGLLATPEAPPLAGDTPVADSSSATLSTTWNDVADSAFEIADAMLGARVR